MTNPHKRSRRLLPAATVALLAFFLASTHPLYAQNNEHPAAAGTILSVAHLNPDCWPDTVWGQQSAATEGAAAEGAAAEGTSFVPTRITWGQPSGDRAEDTACAGPMAKALKRRETAIRLPKWENMTGSVAVAAFNPDTLADVLIMVSGAVKKGRDLHDTSELVLLLGSRALDTVTTVDLSKRNGALHRERFIALSIRRDEELAAPRSRDLSGATSWELGAITFTESEEEEERPGVDDPAHRGTPLLNERRPGTVDTPPGVAPSSATSSSATPPSATPSSVSVTDEPVPVSDAVRLGARRQ